MNARTLLRYLVDAILIIENNKDLASDTQLEQAMRRIQLRWLWQRPRTAQNLN